MFDAIPPLVDALDAAHVRVGREHRELLALIARADGLEIGREWGARDTAHWLAMRYDVSEWKARRWIAAAHALEDLPKLSAALVRGDLGVDKVVELCRFATPETEDRLVAWARRVSCAAVRHRADLESRSTEDVVLAQRSRSVWWWYEDEGRRFRLSADLPAAQGAVIARAIEREAEKVPRMPDEEEDPGCVEARRADALVALCSARVAADPDPDRATVVVHAQVDVDGRPRAAEIEDGPAVHPDEARRMLCNARVQTIVEDPAGDVLGVGRMTREPPAWMLRQLRYRDRECRFPGCGARRFTEAHHIVWWRHGGRTELGNLVLICSFHHRLVHELGWRIRREPLGEVGGSVPMEPLTDPGPLSRGMRTLRTCWLLRVE